MIINFEFIFSVFDKTSQELFDLYDIPNTKEL
ncbi:hypothetical protein ACUXEV_002667 [Staphylococcus saprophyticus]